MTNKKNNNQPAKIKQTEITKPEHKIDNNTVMPLETADKDNDANKKKEDKSALEIIKDALTVATIIGSIFVLVITSLKAYFYSYCFNIPFVEMISTSVMYEIMISVIPFVGIVLLFISSVYSFIHKESPTGKSWKSITPNLIVSIVITIFCNIAILIYYFSLLPIIDDGSMLFDMLNAIDQKYYWLFFGIVIAGSVFLYFVSKYKASESSKNKNNENKIINMFPLLSTIHLFVLAAIFVLFVLYPFIANTIKTCIVPLSSNKYEVTTITTPAGETINCMTVSSNSNGKLVMEYKTYDNKEFMFVIKDRYWYIDAQEYEFSIIEPKISGSISEEDLADLYKSLQLVEDI